MRKNDQYHGASVAIHVTMDRFGAWAGWPVRKIRDSIPHHLSTKWGPNLHHYASGEGNGTAESAFILRDLKVTRKRQYCHKLVIGNWNISLLTGKEHELVEEAKDILWM